MRSEMKMGLGIGLIVLVSVVGFVIINRGEDEQTVPDASITDAGAADEDAGRADAGEGGSTVPDTVRETSLANARRMERERSTDSESDSARDASDTAGGPLSDAAGGPLRDAAEAPATGSDNVGSPSPSNIPAGLSGTDRPGLSGSAATPEPRGLGGASSADVARNTETTGDVADGAVRTASDSDPDTATASPDTEAGRDEESMVAGADRPGSSGTSADRGRVAPSTDDSASSSAGASPGSTPSATMVTSHTIESGDTFSGLAVRYFGHAKYAGLIADANPGLDPRRLHVGKAVKIPDTPQRKERRPETVADSTPTGGGAHSASVASPSDTTSAAESTLPTIPEDRKYVVKASDRGWYDLAERLMGDGGEWPMLYETNKERLPNPERRDLIPVGLEIEIPEVK